VEARTLGSWYQKGSGLEVLVPKDYEAGGGGEGGVVKGCKQGPVVGPYLHVVVVVTIYPLAHR
jgi:hypothetical protein